MAGIRMGVIGVGRIGRLHAEHLAYRVPGAGLTAICDVDPCNSDLGRGSSRYSGYSGKQTKRRTNLPEAGSTIY